MLLSLRVTAMLVLVLAFSLGLTAALSYVKFEKALAGVILSRHQATVRGLSDNIETGLNLGLTLSEIQNYSRLVERATGEHGDLLMAEVRDITGRQVFAHTRAEVTLPARVWAGAMTSPEGWTDIGPDSIGLARPLVNSFGRVVGVVIVEFSRSAYDRALAEIGRFMVEAFTGIIAAGALVACLTGFVLARPFSRSLDSMEKLVSPDLPAEEGNPMRIRDLTDPVAAEIRAIREGVRS